MNKILPVLILAFSLTSTLCAKLKGMPLTPITPTPTEENLPVTTPEMPTVPTVPFISVNDTDIYAPYIPSNATVPMDWRHRVHYHFSFSLGTFHNYQFLTDSRGWSLYVFNADSPSTSTCFADCAVDWPPVLVSDISSIRTFDGIHLEYLSTFTRPDGTLQLVYNGFPLYYYIRDMRPGDVFGEAIMADGDFWYLITPDGLPIRH